MKNLGVYLILVVLVVSIVNMFLTPQTPVQQIPEIPYSQFRTDMQAGKIKDFSITDMKATGHYTDGTSFTSNIVGVKEVADLAAGRGVEVKINEIPATPWWMTRPRVVRMMSPVTFPSPRWKPRNRAVAPWRRITAPRTMTYPHTTST